MTRLDAAVFARESFALAHDVALCYAAEAVDVALPGAPGDELEDLLAASMRHGAAALHRLTRQALGRWLRLGGGVLYSPWLFTREEVEELAGVFAATLGTAELLGRAVVREKVRPAEPVREEKEGGPLPVPVRRQTTGYSCGAAAFQAVLDYWGHHETEAAVAAALGTDPQAGTRPREITAMARSLGLAVDAQEGLEIADVAHVLGQGVPVLCPVRQGGGHWVVVVGIDAAGVRCMDPAAGLVTVPADEFERSWWDTDAEGKRYTRYGIAVGPPKREAVEALETLSTLFEALTAPARPLPPERALAYFQRFLPLPGIANAAAWAGDRFRAGLALALHTAGELLGRVQTFVRDRHNAGRPVTAAPADVREVLDACGVSPARPAYAETVARTQTVQAFVAGVEDERRQPDVAELMPVWRYWNPHDARSRPWHAARDGNYYPASTAFEDVRGRDPVDISNCVLPGASIEGRITGALEAWYAGEAVEVRTRRGHRLALTVNHPVLTEHGFVPAGQLRKGDYLASYQGNDRPPAAGNDVQQAPALIEQVFRSFQALSPFIVKTPTLVDIYGDGEFIKGQIRVVGADRRLRRRADSQKSQRVGNVFLPFPDFRKADGAGNGPGRAHGVAVVLPPPRLVGGLDLPMPFLGVSHAGPFNALGFAAAPWDNSAVRQAQPDCGPAHPQVVGNGLFGLACGVAADDAGGIESAALTHRHIGGGAELDVPLLEPPANSPFPCPCLFGELVEGFPGQVAADKVIDVRRFHYDGPVYDLETSVGYFIADASKKARGGIVIKNCRCIPVVVHRDEWARLKAAGARIADGFQDVPG